MAETKFIKMNKAVVAEDKNIFAKDSVGQVIVEPTSYSPYTEVIAIKATDEEGLPYPTDNSRLYAFAFKEGDYTEVAPMEKISYAIPFGFTHFDDEGEALDLGLEDAYAQKDYSIDKDGNIITKTEQLKKTAELESHIGDKDTVGEAFKEKVEGQDDPSYSEPWTANEKEMPATAPILGELTAKAKELQKKLAEMMPDNLTPNKDDITTDFDSSVGGAGEVKDIYKADEKEEPWKDEHLGETSAKKKTAVTDAQKLRDMESNTDTYTEDDFPISAEDLGLSAEQENIAYKDAGIEDNPEHISADNNVKTEVSH